MSQNKQKNQTKLNQYNNFVNKKMNYTKVCRTQKIIFHNCWLRLNNLKLQLDNTIQKI